METHPLLFTDLYQLTMAQAYYRSGRTAQATFSLFFRSYPPDRAYFVLGGVQDALEYLEGFRFSEDDVEFLSSLGLFNRGFLTHLGQLRFSGSVRAMPEGTVFFTSEPVIEVTALVIEAQIAETMLLNQINLQTILATKASRAVRGSNEDGHDAVHGLVVDVRIEHIGQCQRRLRADERPAGRRRRNRSAIRAGRVGAGVGWRRVRSSHGDVDIADWRDVIQISADHADKRAECRRLVGCQVGRGILKGRDNHFSQRIGTARVARLLSLGSAPNTRSLILIPRPRAVLERKSPSAILLPHHQIGAPQKGVGAPHEPIRGTDRRRMERGRTATTEEKEEHASHGITT